MTERNLGSLLPEDMTLKELATAINRRLRRLEADPEWNKVDKKYGTKNFFGASAHDSGGGVSVCYVSYQGRTHLERHQAEDYLRWLREGNKGSHFIAGHRGRIRPKKRDQEAEALDVEYRISRYGEPVYREIALPEKPGLMRRASEVEEGQRIYFGAKWRKVNRKTTYAPPLPEDVQGKMAEAINAARLEDYATVQKLARQVERAAEQLEAERDVEIHLALAGGQNVYLTPNCQVAVK